MPKKFRESKIYLPGKTRPSNWVAFLISSSEASPFLGLLLFTGNKINLDWYSFSLCTFRWSDSKDLFLRLWSTLMPMVLAWNYWKKNYKLKLIIYSNIYYLMACDGTRVLENLTFWNRPPKLPKMVSKI